MGTVNSKRTTAISTKKHESFRDSKAHLNFMGGYSYKIGDPIYNLRLAASSCFFGEPSYYKDGSIAVRSSVKRGMDSKTRSYLASVLGSTEPKEWAGKNTQEMIELAIDNALDFNAEATLQEAVRLRNEEDIRTTPQVILVRAANHKKVKGTNLVRKYAPSIISRGDEPAVCLAYQLSAFGRPVPNSLKRALADKLESMNEYSLAKYRMEERDVKTVDVVNLVHPTYTEALTKLVNGTLKLTDETWEALRSKGKSWEECIPVMGHMALLRNLRNFVQNKVNENLYLPKLLETAKNGKQLPFRYYTAYKELAGANGRILDAIEECLNISLGKMPHFAGRTMSLCDNSGSAQGATTSTLGTMKISEIANLTGVLTGKISDDGYVGVFGDKLDAYSIRKNSSVFDDLNKLAKSAQSIGQSTEHGIWLFWDKAIKQKEHWDNVFIYSDMQAGHGGLYGTGGYDNYRWQNGRCIDVPKLVAEYRKKINPKVNVFCVQVAGYQDTIIPEHYDRTYILGGWGDGLLRFANSMVQLPQ